MDLVSSVGIASCYRLDGPRIRTPVRDENFLTSLLYNGCRVSFLGVKQSGSGVDHPHFLAPWFKRD